MLRSIFMAVITVRLLGTFWSIVAGMMIILGGVSAMHFVWHILLTATAP